MRLVSIVCIQDAGTDGNDFRLIYYFDDNGAMKTKTVKTTAKKHSVNSIINEHSSADLYEREIHDYYGVEFVGNTHLHTHLFLPEETHVHPMLKKTKKEDHKHA